MRILYLDTSSSFLYCGIILNNQLVGQVKEQLGKNLSSLTLVKIEELFTRLNIKPNEIDKILVVNGPGSFTGIRVGVTIAKTYAYSLQKPIITISSLEAMALSCDTEADYFIPLIDARRNYVFGGVYDESNNQILKNQYISLDSVKVAAENLPGTYVFITNDNLNIADNKEAYDPDILKIVNFYQYRESTNPHGLDALYLKKTEAEEKLNDNRDKD